MNDDIDRELAAELLQQRQLMLDMRLVRQRGHVIRGRSNKPMLDDRDCLPSEMLDVVNDVAKRVIA